MTIGRGVAVSLLMLAATVWLVGFCGVPGLLVWLSAVCAVGCWPDAALRVVSSIRWRHIRDGWRALDRR